MGGSAPRVELARKRAASEGDDCHDEDAASGAEHAAAAAPTHLFVVLADMEHNAGLGDFEGPCPLGVARTINGAEEILKNYHDAYEAKRTLKDSSYAQTEFEGLETKKTGKVVGEAQAGDVAGRVEKWKIAVAKEPSTDTKYTAADADASAPGTFVHYAYTLTSATSDYYGDTGANAFGGVALLPSSVALLACAKLPCKGSAALKLPPTDPAAHKDGALVAEERFSRHKGKQYMGSAQRWVVRDWEAVEEKKNSKKAPPRKKARMSE
ncbi:hypothetical protein C8J57DRAFT_306104 [Mycena rebaudengoi]|nr:hypothetical protein C8J57DRAFT_306104 [Mycena rebaudengoi]